MNRPRSIYQYSNMAPRLSGQTSIFGVVSFVSKSPLGIERQKKLEKICNFDPKASEPCLNIDISNVGYSTSIFPEAIMHRSIPAVPIPPGQPRGVCSRCQSRG